MNFPGEENNQPTCDAETQNVRLPWETIEPEEPDRNTVGDSAETALALYKPAITDDDIDLSEPADVSAAGSEHALVLCSEFEADGFEEDDELIGAGGPVRGGGWTLPLICAAIGLIACCMIIPQADANRRLAYQKAILQRDLDSLKNQATVNDEFLKRVYDDDVLAQRLAQRQMNVVPAGSRVWQVSSGIDPQQMSPYGLTQVPKPAPLAPYRPIGGEFAALCRDPRSNLYLTGTALLMLAVGLVMGFAKNEALPA